MDNHDNQRNHGGGEQVLTYKDGYDYKVATAFHIGHVYSGQKRVMSSYEFTDPDAGPPSAQPNIGLNTFCENGWVCEHRWPTVGALAQVYNIVHDIFLAFDMF